MSDEKMVDVVAVKQRASDQVAGALLRFKRGESPFREVVERYNLAVSLGCDQFAMDLFCRGFFAVVEVEPVEANEMDRPVYDLELSTRVANALVADGYQTLGDLLMTTEKKLLRVPHIGRLALRQIREVLEPYRPGSSV